jgi:predicted alpha/beta superfamily hydrolase
MHPPAGVTVIKSLLAVCLLSFGAYRFPAHAELLPAHADALDSALLHQKRAIDVFLPKDHEKEPARRYETLYVLDGDWNAKLVVRTVDFLQSTGWMPPVIVISVPNCFDDKGVNSRDRDLTPSPQPNEPLSGGAPQFIAFLKTELIPYVNQRYPTSGVNLVHGHSYGGLFLNYVIAPDPAVFDGYLILDPAMWWGNKEVSKLLTEKELALHLRTGPIWKPARAAKADEKSTCRYKIYAPEQWPHFHGAPMKAGKTDDDLDKLGSDDFAGIADGFWIWGKV